VRAAASHRHVDTTSDHHGRAGKPEQNGNADTQSIADAVADAVADNVGLADRESHAHTRPHDADAAGARSVLRCR
jgi:hypothetical protein